MTMGPPPVFHPHTWPSQGHSDSDGRSDEESHKLHDQDDTADKDFRLLAVARGDNEKALGMIMKGARGDNEKGLPGEPAGLAGPYPLE